MRTYNTNQIPLRLKEYGRNVQKLVAQLEQVQDKSTRTQHAQAILKIMGIFHSANAKATTDYSQKRWDDLFIISDYKLDIDSPYPMPNRELLIKRPQRLGYSKKSIKYRHCGYHIELFVKKVLEVTEASQQAEAIVSIGKLIKSFSAAWNKDNLDTNTIMAMIQDLSGGKLMVDMEKLKSDNSFNTSNNGPREKDKPPYKKRRISFVSKA